MNENLVALAARLEGVEPSAILAVAERENGELVIVVAPGQKHVWSASLAAEQIAAVSETHGPVRVALKKKGKR